MAVTTPLGQLHYSLEIAGRHNVDNSLAAVACAVAAGVPLPAIAQGLGAFRAVKGRSQARLLRLQGRQITLVDDSYNANPDSVQAAIELLASLPAPRLLVLGDMGEVGEQGPQFHAQAGELAHQHGIEALFTLGPLSASSAGSFGAGRHFADMAGLQDAVLAALPGLGSLLVKGARSMKMERVLELIDAQASDSEVPHAA